MAMGKILFAFQAASFRNLLSSSNAAFSSDSNRLLTGSNDHILRIWDTGCGKLLHTLNDHQQDEKQNIYPFFLSLSADSKKAVTGGMGGIRIWDVTSGKQLLKISFPLGYATTLSPDGRFVTSIGPWGIKIWEAITGRELCSFGEYLKHVNAMLFLHDNRTLITAYDNLIFWDMATQKELLLVFNDFGEFSGIAFSPDGRKLAAAITTGYVRVWTDGDPSSLKAGNCQ